jgi:putative endonuclease
MSKRRQQIGRWGEEQAAHYLTERGYEILDRNLRTPHGEIDLVACYKGLTIFVEVKARTSDLFGPPEEAINARKQAHLIACAEYYAQQHELDAWQIDAISVEGKPGQEPLITHFENVIS